MWKLGSGEDVIDRHRSHLHHNVLQILPEALSKVEAEGEVFIRKEVKFDRIVGENHLVATGSGDQIVYAKRPKRWGHTRFVLNRNPEPSSSVVVLLKKAEEDNLYILITAFIGELSAPEPWDRNATEESLEFWSNHALCFGYEEILEETLTTECPW